MRTLKVIFYLALFYFAMSCGMMQHATTTTDKSTEQFSSTADLSRSSLMDKTDETQSLTFYTDSTNQSYAVQLWPRGPFKYSASTGFEGEAEKVLISGKVAGLKKGNSTTDFKSKQTGHAELKLETASKGKASQTAVIKNVTPSPWWILGGLTLLGALLFFFLKIKF